MSGDQKNTCRMWQRRTSLSPFGNTSGRVSDLAGGLARGGLHSPDILRPWRGNGMRVFGETCGEARCARVDRRGVYLALHRPQPRPGENKRYAEKPEHRRNIRNCGRLFNGKGCVGRDGRRGSERAAGGRPGHPPALRVQAVAILCCGAGGSRTAITSGRSIT